ncbi:MAG TPA: MFS transporter [Pirellulales bacterium]|jgi:MFS family permease|nr:MFS transporter [Pirellulales bacterium]
MQSNRKIFWASFLTLIAAGMGFAIRGDVLSEWEREFGFTKTELGTITGGGLVGMAFTIIGFSLFADRVGYKLLLIGAFLLHVCSAAVTLAATPVYQAAGQNATYWCLYVGMFMFSLANGMCEAAINPLVATLYPKQKTHYLNILHAGWPGGLILGGLLAVGFVGPETRFYLRWEIPMMFFLVPTLWYGMIVFKEKFPVSEARAAGVRFGEMLAEFTSIILLFLLLLHALVGYVELGTDSWVTNITKDKLATIGIDSVLLLVYTAGLMFVLRFFAGPIVERINPLGLLFVSACLGSAGLFMMGTVLAGEAGWSLLIAATVYGVGKTFLWPTMLGVVGERFPKGGALAMGAMGGVGMLSAGLLGSPGIGYTQDVFASAKLREEQPSLFEKVEAKTDNHFLFFKPVRGFDGTQVEKIAATDPEQFAVIRAASEFGGQQALKVTSAIPATMAVGYLLLLIYFRATGGYKLVEIGPGGREREIPYEPNAREAIYKDSQADQA